LHGFNNFITTLYPDVETPFIKLFQQLQQLYQKLDQGVETGRHLRLPTVSRLRWANSGADDDHLSIVPTEASRLWSHQPKGCEFRAKPPSIPG